MLKVVFNYSVDANIANTNTNNKNQQISHNLQINQNTNLKLMLSVIIKAFENV